jgi:UDP-N-acetylglucosamine 2-epimerase (non-hydrolysing)
MSIKILKDKDLRNTVAVVMGTRPGIIKMAPLVKEFTRRGIDNYIIHTGQHYSENMDLSFFRDLELPAPAHRVNRTQDHATHAGQTAEMLVGVEQVLMKTKPKITLVCGDANTNLAAGLAARKLGIVVGHVESGLRSYDWRMPEEHNRIILDHISELLFAPTEKACRNLLYDNVRGEIYLTGNTIVDATLEGLEIAKKKGIVLGDFGVKERSYALFTAHREENVDIVERLEKILKGVYLATREINLQAIFPVHPRTRKRLMEFGFLNGVLNDGQIKVIDPVTYLEFLTLVRHAAVVLTDSGGVQEESCIVHTPCVTLRENTERPETIAVRSNRIAGTSPNEIVRSTRIMMKSNRKWEIPFGDGKAALRIADAIENVFQRVVNLVDISRSSRASLMEQFRLSEVQ